MDKETMAQGIAAACTTRASHMPPRPNPTGHPQQALHSQQGLVMLSPLLADTLAGKEASAARRCLAVLQQAAAQPGFLPPPPGSGRAAAAGGSHQQQLNLVDVLAALRWASFP